MKKIWGGRIKKELDKDAAKFNASIDFDKRLFEFDVLAGIAHTKALNKAEIINKNEMNKIIRGLKTLLKKEKAIEWSQYEDIHSAVEIELVKLIGETGKKLHTGRSRNDLVATDEKLFLKKEIKLIKKLLLNLLNTLLLLAEKNKKNFMPGYTHLQQAQIISVAQWFLCYFQKIKRDYELLKFIEERVDFLPLGAGAISGAGFELDRKFIAKELGFKNITANSMDTVSDRGFIAEFIYFTAITATHLSRLAEDIIIFNSNEFSYIEIDDSFATGSSLMPNKKNPDIAELIRGKTGIFYGYLISVLTMLKGLPMTYNKDMQEDKKPLFSAVDEIKNILFITEKFIKNIEFNREKLENNINNSFMFAVDIADYLVKKGIAFRDAHFLTGKLIAYCIEKGKRLKELTEDELKSISKHFNKDLLKLLSPETSVNLRKTAGSTSEKEINNQIKNAKQFIRNET